MLPQLSTHDSAHAASTPIQVPPPARFRPLCGQVRNVTLGKTPFGHSRAGMSEAQKSGLRYEDKVQAALRGFHRDYVCSPAFHFTDDSGPRTVIPDGMLNTPSVCYVFEIKSQHMPEAWWWLEKLYKPVVRERNPLRPVYCIEVVRSYDPTMPFPGHFQLLTQASDIFTMQSDFGVLPWRM